MVRWDGSGFCGTGECSPGRFPRMCMWILLGCLGRGAAVERQGPGEEDGWSQGEPNPPLGG